MGISVASSTAACDCPVNVLGQPTSHATAAMIATELRRKGIAAANSLGPNRKKLARIARTAGSRNSHQLIGGRWKRYA